MHHAKCIYHVLWLYPVEHIWTLPQPRPHYAVDLEFTLDMTHSETLCRCQFFVTSPLLAPTFNCVTQFKKPWPRRQEWTGIKQEGRDNVTDVKQKNVSCNIVWPYSCSLMDLFAFSGGGVVFFVCFLYPLVLILLARIINECPRMTKSKSCRSQHTKRGEWAVLERSAVVSKQSAFKSNFSEWFFPHLHDGKFTLVPNNWFS